MAATERFGPFEVGESIAGARLVRVDTTGESATLELDLGERDTVTFALAGSGGPGDEGPFAECRGLTHRRTPLPFSAFETPGRQMARRVAAACGDRRLVDVVDGWLRESRGDAWDGAHAGPAPAPRGDWRAELEALVDRPDAAFRFGDRPGAVGRAAERCTLPWTRLELGMGEAYGPCCPDFQTRPASGRGAPLALFHSDAMRAFRRALAGEGHPVSCRRSCPRLAGRSDALGHLVLRGGPRAFIDNQRRVVEAILAGDDAPDATPLDVCFPTTSFCNYDCLMCRFGEEGVLDDELPEAFYDSLEPLLPGVSQLEALGGEPLASPVFREVLASDRLARFPQVRVSLTTNGSYLTPSALRRYAHVRFGHLTVSLNAATPETYAAVNRGLPFARIRENLDAILERRDAVGDPAVTYSMVLLRANLHEVEAFAELARRDGAGVRFQLPMFDRNGQSILTDPAAMRAAEEQLRHVARALFTEGRVGDAHRARGEADVLRDRHDRGVFRPLPDDAGLVTLRS